MRHGYHPEPFFFHRQVWVLAAFACGIGRWTSCYECLSGLTNLLPSPLIPVLHPFITFPPPRLLLTWGARDGPPGGF